MYRAIVCDVGCSALTVLRAKPRCEGGDACAPGGRRRQPKRPRDHARIRHIVALVPCTPFAMQKLQWCTTDGFDMAKDLPQANSIGRPASEIESFATNLAHAAPGGDIGVHRIVNEKDVPHLAAIAEDADWSA